MASSTANNPPQWTDFADHIAAQWSAREAGRCLLAVGLSGGIDSVVLLHVLHRLKHRLPANLEAIHVHHGISPNADAWADFCRQLCAQWQIPLRIHKVQIAHNGQGLEAAARAARYGVFADSPAGIIALAHHADDQTETFFLGALRGGGVRALAAMPAWRERNGKTFWRPLLPFSRAQIAAYAAHFRLPFIEDESNTDSRFLRNWLRCQGLPAWRERVPHLDAHIQTAVSRAQDELAVLDEIVATDWRQVCAGGFFCVATWRRFSPPRRRHLLAEFARRHQLGTPRHISVSAFADELSQPATQHAVWHLPNGRAEFSAGGLWPLPADAFRAWPWLAQLPCAVGATSVQAFLQWRPSRFGLPEKPSDSIIRLPEKDDTLLLPHGRKNVRKYLQDRKIPAALRPIWPVLSTPDGRCLTVVNLAVDSELAVAGGVMPCIDALLSYARRMEQGGQSA